MENWNGPVGQLYLSEVSLVRFTIFGGLAQPCEACRGVSLSSAFQPHHLELQQGND